MHNRNISEISKISEIIALLFHLCALFYDYCYPRVGHGALLGGNTYYSRLLAFSRDYSVAIIVYHYTRLWQAWFCAHNANNAEIIVKELSSTLKRVYHYTLLCAIIHDYVTIIALIVLIAIIALFSLFSGVEVSIF